MNLPDREHLVELRRDFHRHPEPAWREFRTSARIVEEVERIGVDELYVGPDAIDPDERLGVPDAAEIERWYEQASGETERHDVLEQVADGVTGVVAVLDRGPGPTVGLRVDIDALPIQESDEESHYPAAEGFRSEHEGTMHACGHDAHTTFGIGVLEAVASSDFSGTFKALFQPAEEVVGGGKPMAAGGHLADVDYLFGVHVGLDHPTGEVVAGIDEALAVSQFDIEFTGESAHAGLAPNQGRNAVQALATGIENLYGIARHEEGATRINVGELHSTNASNVIADRATAAAEVRGETTELMTYMRDRAFKTLEAAADMHECSVSTTVNGQAPRQDSDEELVSVVADAADTVSGVDSVVRRAPLGASEDVTHLMREVRNHGGVATFVGIGTDHPGGHHTPTFDVDEDSLPIGVAVLSESILAVAG